MNKFMECLHMMMNDSDYVTSFFHKVDFLLYLIKFETTTQNFSMKQSHKLEILNKIVLIFSVACKQWDSGKIVFCL